MNLRFIHVFIFLILFTETVFANIIKVPNDTSKFKLGILPSLFYTPETRAGAGVLIYTHFNLDKNNPLNKKSNTQTYASYSLNKQFAFENDYQLWLKNNNVYLTGALDFTRFPELYFGIGNDTKKDVNTLISFDAVKFVSKNLIRIDKNIYGGFYYQFQKLYNQSMQMQSNDMCMVNTNGFSSYTASGIGPILIVDKRDNPLNPEKGSYFETSFQHFDKQLGSQTNFNSLVVDARKFNTIFKKLVWNGNAYVNFNNGDVPFRMLATIGGARFLRGYYRGRFRDNNLIILQQEFRIPVYKRIGIAAFGGMGAVAKNVSDYKKNEIHYNYGVGLRIKINKKENTNLRIDYGFTKDSRGLYVVFAEAF